ncbi:MAG: 4Fe-4S binding protein [Candidatus Methanomethylicia archaeon]
MEINNIEEAEFSSNCIRCLQCIEKCPEKTLSLRLSP